MDPQMMHMMKISYRAFKTVYDYIPYVKETRRKVEDLKIF